jgi:DNA-binding MarR family transcriptional regulator
MESEKDGLIKSIQERTRLIAMLPVPMPDLSAMDLTMTQLRMVMLLYQKKRMRVSELAAILGVTSATVSGIVDRLVERGAVVREADPEDRRAVICCLSQHGLEMMDGFQNTQRQRLDSLLVELSVKHLRAYDDLMAAITEIIMRRGQVSDKPGTA